MSKPVESVVTQPVYIHDVRKEQQDWLREARRFCRCVGIGVSEWGADSLIVEAKSPDRVKQISSQLRQFGLSPIENEDDAGAGLLLLSRNPAATRPNKSSVGTSRRPWDAQIVPLLWGAGSIVSFRTGINSPTPSSWLFAAFGAVLLLVFVWDGSRIWGWRLEILSEGIRLRRRFRWNVIPWEDIRAVDAVPIWVRDQESVVLKLVTHTSESLGTFNFIFARILRDRLKVEITRRHEPVTNS